MIDEFKYGFWIWSNKLDPVLSVLSHLVDYELSKDERDVIKFELSSTNDEQNIWNKYTLNGKKHKIELSLAYDSEEDSAMIHLCIQTSKELKEKLESLNLFQSMFKELIE